MQATYQTRMLCDDAALSAYAALYGRVQRRLFAEVSSGRSAASMKRGCVREYGIPARMFNAVRVSLEGKVSGARESQLLHPETLKGLVRRVGWELAGARRGVTGTGSIRRCAGWTTCGPGWRGSRPTRRRAWSGCASAALPARERVREWLLPIRTIFTMVSENGYNATGTHTVVVTRTEVT